MSLGLVILTDEGVVLAAESLGTLLAQEQTELRTKCPKCNQDIKPQIGCPTCGTVLGPAPTLVKRYPAMHTHYCQKLFRLSNTAGMIIVGTPSFGEQKAQQVVFGFVNWLTEEKKIGHFAEQIVQDWAEYLVEAKAITSHRETTEIVVAGIKERGSAIPFAQSMKIENGKFDLGTITNNGIVAIGVHDILDKMFTGGQIAQYPVKEFPLQDAVEFADFLIQTQIGVDKYSAKIPRVGGDIDIAVVHPNHGFHWVRQKELHKAIGNARIDE
jgi:hypothetical protein